MGDDAGADELKSALRGTDVLKSVAQETFTG